MIARGLAFLAASSMAVALAGCGGAEARAYDIAPIFPLSAGKCAKYGGEQEGSGPTEKCMVTKAQCEKAASAWSKAMQAGAVYNAIQFTCNEE